MYTCPIGDLASHVAMGGEVQSFYDGGIILNNNLYLGLVSKCGEGETLFCLGLATRVVNIHVCHPGKVVCQHNVGNVRSDAQENKTRTEFQVHREREFY